MSSTKGKPYILTIRAWTNVTFGKGKKSLVIIPGLGDGIQTVKGMDMSFQSHTVYLPNVTKFMFFSNQ